MNTAKISICIPAYNDSEYLNRALESICKSKNIKLEILISDDCSYPSLKTTVEPYMENFPQHEWRYYYHEQNLGVAKNKNLLINNCTGTLVAFFEHDDILIDFDFYSNCSVLYLENQNIKAFISNAKIDYTHRSILLNKVKLNSDNQKLNNLLIDGQKIVTGMLRLRQRKSIILSWSSVVFEREAALTVGAFTEKYLASDFWANKLNIYNNEENMVFLMLILDKHKAYYSLQPSTIRTVSSKSFSVSPNNPSKSMKNDIEFFNLLNASKMVKSKKIRKLMVIKAVSVGIKTLNLPTKEYISLQNKLFPVVYLSLFFGVMINPFRYKIRKINLILENSIWHLVNNPKEFQRRARLFINSK
jgi:glycosyltransferase involved in cell wall biosynthesis